MFIFCRQEQGNCNGLRKYKKFNNKKLDVMKGPFGIKEVETISLVLPSEKKCGQILFFTYFFGSFRKRVVNLNNKPVAIH